MKKAIVVFILVAVVAFGVWFFLSNFNTIVAGVIEKRGSEVTNTRVGVSGVDISLREGRGSIKGLSIASPEGFTAPEAFSLGDITVDIDIGSIREDPVVIDEVVIRAPVVYAEIAKNGSSNIEELRKRVVGYSASVNDEGGGGNRKDDKRIRIKRFVFEQGRVDIDATALGVEKRSITLPEIRLGDVGGADGAPPDQIAKVILTTVTRNVASEIGKSEVNRLIKKQMGGESITDKAKDLLNKLGD